MIIYMHERYHTCFKVLGKSLIFVFEK